MRRLLLIAAVSVGMGLISLERVDAAPQGLDLEIALDEKTYLLAQPILTLLTVRNAGPSDFEDFAPLETSEPWLELELTNLDTGKPVQFGGIRTMSMYPARGPTLAAGHADVITLNLLQLFGDDARGGLPGCLRSRVLPEGHYRLDVGFRPKLHGSSSDPVQPLRAATDFRIAPISSDKRESDRVQAFLSGCPDDETALHGPSGYCIRSLNQFLGSKFFMLVYYQSGTGMRSVPLDDLLSILDRHDPSPVRKAWLIGLRCKIDRLSPDERLTYVTRLKGKRTDELSQRVLHAWEDRLRPSKSK